jgi:hypothetical protein
VVSAVIAVTAMTAEAQQDEGPILLPRKPVVKPASATLPVLCDLACDGGKMLSCNNFGTLYQKACKGGFESACSNLSSLH